MGKAVGAVTGAIGGGLGSVVGGLTGGLADGMVSSNGFRATSARIDDAASMGQAATAYEQTQAALKQQQDFVNALNAQNGVANQTSVFNQLQGAANGTGPNPAQAMLNQATGANVANQAALMAGQRGASQNAGLIARQAALQGGNLQQQAAAQGATMQANQSLGALNQLGSLASGQVAQQQNALAGYNQFAQGQQSNILNSIQAQNNARVNMANGMNTANQATDAQNTKARNDFTMGLVQGGAAAMSDKRQKKNVKSGDDDVQAFLDSISSKSYEYKDPKFGEGKQVGVMAQDLEKAPGGEQMIQETPEGKAVDYGKGLGMMTAALAQINERLNAMEGKGSEKKSKKASKKEEPINAAFGFDGEKPLPAPATGYNLNALGGMNSAQQQYNLGANSQGMMPAQAQPQVQVNLGADMKMPDYSAQLASFMTGKPIQQDPSTQLNSLMNSDPNASSESKGGQAMGMAAASGLKSLMSSAPAAMADGGKVPGKPKKPGKDTIENDTVSAKLTPGEIVLPLSVTQSENPAEAAAAFVRAIMAKKSKRKGL